MQLGRALGILGGPTCAILLTVPRPGAFRQDEESLVWFLRPRSLTEPRVCSILAQESGGQPCATGGLCPEYKRCTEETLSSEADVMRAWAIASHFAILRVGAWGALCAYLSVAGEAAGQVWWEQGDQCRTAERASFSDGYQAGQAAGFTDGYSQGADDGAAFCTANPLLCGVPLDACMPPASYGETEPNDNLVSADPLPFGQDFWGQSYGAVDQDWYYIVTTEANQNLTVSLSVPDGSPLGGWRVAIRDASGNVFAQFDSSGNGNVASSDGGITYRMTLGLAGTYYIVVQPAGGAQSFAAYNLAAILQGSPSDTVNYVVGFADVEQEPNNLPGQSTWLTGGVTMYGITNLQFDQVAYIDDGSRAYLQGEPDWFAYITPGAEVVTLSFCDRQTCSAGDWFVELYDFEGANAVAAGGDATPLLAINTNTSASDPIVYRVSLAAAGTYYLRVNHKRLLSAPCAGYLVDINGNGLVNNNDSVNEEFLSCGCPGGQNCSIQSTLPADLGSSVVSTDPESGETSAEWFCPNGSSATVIAGTDAAARLLLCDTTCECVTWRNTVTIPEGAVTSQYNFTWQATSLPPGTYATDAYQGFRNRPTPY